MNTSRTITSKIETRQHTMFKKCRDKVIIVEGREIHRLLICDYIILYICENTLFSNAAVVLLLEWICLCTHQLEDSSRTTQNAATTLD